jgi:hypothetical protein
MIGFESFFDAVVQALTTEVPLSEPYTSEPAFERAVWKTLHHLCVQHFGVAKAKCVLLCSHYSLNLPGRSQSEWNSFLNAGHADFQIFGMDKRVDFALSHPDGQRIGIEVECFTQANKADALVIGLGQTMLALGHRERTILIGYCGSPTPAEREALDLIATRVSEHPRVRVVLLVAGQG